ncbi:MAG: hypothetical protein IKD72_01520, partial [Clostridia bacterium]|nr:hypothetical protein [Clostridia bacterium]
TAGVSAFSFAAAIDPTGWLQRPFGIVFFEGEAQQEIRMALRTIFPSNSRSGNCVYAEICMARKWIEENRIQTPLDCADPHWGDILRSDAADWCHRSFALQYHDFLMEIPTRMLEIAEIDRLYEGRYPSEKLRLFYKFYYVSGGAVGWILHKNDFEKRLEAYMSCECCRECGKPFQAKWKDGAVETCQADDLSILHFSMKDIVGLNKKLLGRYQEEYFCIRCLSEILDTTPQALYEKAHAFKEQGCTLFS